MVDKISSRRSFVCKLMGLIPTFMLVNPKQLRAAKQETKDLLGQLEMDLLRRSRPKRNASMACRSSDKSITLYLRKDGREIPIHMMNATGHMIWKACDGRRTFKEISGLIRERFRVSEQKAQSDALFFLSQLKQSQAITVSNHGV